MAGGKCRLSDSRPQASLHLLIEDGALENSVVPAHNRRYIKDVLLRRSSSGDVAARQAVVTSTRRRALSANRTQSSTSLRWGDDRACASAINFLSISRTSSM